MQCVKGQDTAARYGGEEFAIILPTTNGHAVAENIRGTVASKKVVCKDSGKALGEITLSLGVASYRPGELIADLIRRADEALYIAKKDGRNRVNTERVLRSVVAVRYSIFREGNSSQPIQFSRFFITGPDPDRSKPDRQRGWAMHGFAGVSRTF